MVVNRQILQSGRSPVPGELERKGSMSLPAAGPFGQTSQPPHNLPVQVTSFIGRQREIAEVIHQLSTGRLLTLTGSGGTGKTRLALQVAAELLEHYPHGVWLVELAPVSDPNLVALTAATALGLREEPGQPLSATLAEALRARRLLLVLDNCEHLLDASAKLAEILLTPARSSRFWLPAARRWALPVRSPGGSLRWRCPTRRPNWSPRSCKRSRQFASSWSGRSPPGPASC